MLRTRKKRLSVRGLVNVPLDRIVSIAKQTEIPHAELIDPADFVANLPDMPWHLVAMARLPELATVLLLEPGNPVGV